ncbi:MAG: PQQ-binding-like beta-propeller repeat protein [Zavarzinella sp.]
MRQTGKSSQLGQVGSILVQAILIGLLAAETGNSADWPQHLGPTRNGISQEKGLRRTFPKDYQPSWERNVGSGWAGLAGNTKQIILFHRIENNEVLESLDTSTGKVQWMAKYPTKYRDDFSFDDGPRATPLLLDQVVITLGADGDLASHQLSDGKEIWRKNLLTIYEVEKGYFGVATSPLQMDGKILVNVGGKQAGIVAFDLQTGKEIWKVTSDDASYSSPRIGKLQGQEVAIFFTRSGLACVNSAGKLVCQYPFRPRIGASVQANVPVGTSNEVFLSTAYSTGLVKLELAAGDAKEIWTAKEGLECHFNTPVLVDGFLYGIDGRQEGGAGLACLDWSNGKQRWKKKATGCAGIIAVDGMLILTTESGEIILVEPDPKEYRELARVKVLESPVRALPAMIDGKLYVRDAKKLYCLPMK